MKKRDFLSKGTLWQLFLLLFLTAAFAVPIFCQNINAAPKEEKLLNGLKLLMFDVPAGDKVTFRVRIHAGSAFDPQGKEGLMKLLAANIFPNPEAKEYFAERLGGSLDVQSNYDYIQVNVTAKSDSLVSAMETVANAVINTDIDKETTVKLKARQRELLSGLEKDPAYVADRAAAARLLGTYPYGRPEDGTPDSLAKIDFADVLAAKQRFFTADNATVLVAGSFDEPLAFRAVRRYFGSWLKSDKLVPSTFRQPDEPPAGVQLVKSPVLDKFEVRYITRGTSRGSNDWAAYQIAAKVIEARMAKSLPLGVGGPASVISMDHILPGTFVIRLSGTTSSAAAKVEASDIVLKNVSDPVTGSEFQTAKQAAAADMDKRDIYDRWLDVDTFKTDKPAKWQDRFSATSLGDVQTVLSRIKSQPIAAVVVSPAKAA
jgi:predicted Zn-dependent peptidase